MDTDNDMEDEQHAWRVRIYLSEHDTPTGKHEPLWEVVLDLLQREGAAGATVLRGLGGFGASRKIKLARLADMVPNLPIILEWIDSRQTVERLLPRIRERMHDGLITVEEVRLIA